MTESACRELGIDHQNEHGTYLTKECDNPATAVVGLVGTLLDRGAKDLPPLHEVVDTGALNSFVRPDRVDPGATRVRIEFEYVGCEVTVFEDGEVTVYEVPDQVSRQ
jgi:hypothetical protein